MDDVQKSKLLKKLKENDERCPECGNYGLHTCIMTPDGQVSVKLNDTEGFKHDKGKPRLSLLPWRSLFDVARVMEWAISKEFRGKKAYPRDDWKNLDPERLVEASMRHLASHMDGDLQDSESGQMHLAHAAASVLCALWHHTKKTKLEK